MTTALILITIIIWSIYDIYLIIKEKETISQRITWMSKYKTPSVPLLIGFLAGHWFG